MICNGQALHAKLFSSEDERHKPAASVEQAVFGMDVEMGKHRIYLWPGIEL